MIPALTWIATAASALFAGAALYISLVEHPARLACGPPMAVAQFRTSYPRGAALQAPLATVGGLGGIGAWLAGAPAGWLAAGLALGVAVPFTFAAVMPTNRRLLDRTLAPDTPEVEHLLRRWGALHLVRTVLSLIALGIMIGLRAGG